MNLYYWSNRYIVTQQEDGENTIYLISNGTTETEIFAHEIIIN